MAVTDPTAEELRDLSLACSKLWDLDNNRLEPSRDYEINLGRGKKCFQEGDAAPQPLFVRVDAGALQGRRTFAAFCSLLDNYERDTRVAETVTAQERAEEQAFLTAVTATRPMQYVHQYLARKNLVAGNPEDFRRQLHQMWFSLYSRSHVRDGTCGFEHVFVGEMEEGKVVGFHNWIQFYLCERAGQVNYLGHLLPRGRHAALQGQAHAEVDAGERMVSLQFAWGAEKKDVSSIWIGTSPEFELALYTLCFVAGAEENLVTIAGYELKIRTYHIHSKYGDKVGSSFPELLSKQPGFHRPAPSAPPALPWQQGTPASQHAGWDVPPAPQYNQQAQQGYYQQPNHASQGYQQQAWQPAGYQPSGYAQPQLPMGAQQGCGSLVLAIVEIVRKVFKF